MGGAPCEPSALLESEIIFYALVNGSYVTRWLDRNSDKSRNQEAKTCTFNGDM